ncbi:hypothetical protein [Deinococcus marmoris]|uniref:Terminase B protein n=1 Tax=Deinococcus marmoris TaxID=249408 RepID=A0A1U7P2Z8_9DEIO|nr:hypothetical protein [Deinococcus marmoris]OLV19542.1 terminase B protein [Deinococcus marmoris]
MSIQQQIDRILGRGGPEHSGTINPSELLKAARSNDLNRYQRDLLGYAASECGFVPWESPGDHDSQAGLYRAIQQSVNAQLDGEPATYEFSIKSGHGLGKTISAAVLVNWFFDAFPDSIILTSAPTAKQVKLLLWKDIRRTRPAAGQHHLQPVESSMSKSATHWALGSATSNAGGQGSARMQGQHAPFMLFIFDEADGVDKYLYEAVSGMMTSIAPGNVAIFLRIGNPQSRSSEFHRRHDAPGVMSLNFDVLDYPNVLSGDEIIPGGTGRTWVNLRIGMDCTATPVHDENQFTFSVDWPTVDKNGTQVPAGHPLLPNSEFLWRARGITPPNAMSDTVIGEGRYLGALHREVEPTVDDVRKIYIGADMARFGTDVGTIYMRQSLRIRKIASIHQQDGHAYLAEVAKAMEAGIAEAGCYDLEGLPVEVSIRVDGSGGYGTTLIDLLKLVEMPPGVTMTIHEVSFGASASDPTAYYDIATEMYASTDDVLAYHRVEADDPQLKIELTDRKISFRPGRDKRVVRKLEKKDDFKKRHKRSPDDGDGFVLCAAEEQLFLKKKKKFFFGTVR